MWPPTSLTADRFENPDSAYSFDGNGDYILLANPVQFHLQDFTITAWIKLDTLSLPYNFSIFNYGNRGYGFEVGADTWAGQFGIHPRELFLTKIDVDAVGAGAVGNTPEDPAIGDATAWHHVAVTKSVNTVVFYLNGEAYPAVSQYDPGFVFNNEATIGIRKDNLTNDFFGSIDEVTVFSRALEPSEVQALAIKGLYPRKTSSNGQGSRYQRDLAVCLKDLPRQAMKITIRISGEAVVEGSMASRGTELASIEHVLRERGGLLSLMLLCVRIDGEVRRRPETRSS